MTLRLYLTPSPAGVDDSNGIGRIVHAQYRYLPDHGITFVDDPAQADVTACHIEAQGRQVDIAHLHGVYYGDLPHDPLLSWHHEANHRIAATCRQARRITVPSPWVGETFRRDMRIDPVVIGHGIDVAEWEPMDGKGYLLWAKGRSSDVCDPGPAWELARRGVPVVATFAPRHAGSLDNYYVVGAQSFGKMRALVRGAGVYLANVPETFGIQTIEALCAGVPILGYRWGGTADIVTHGVDGYLVEPGDVDGLMAGWQHIQADYARYRAAARKTGLTYSWDRAMAQYAALYREVAEEKARERHRVCVVVTSFNYGAYLPYAMQSLMRQTVTPDQVIIVNDGSTDGTAEIAKTYDVTVITQDNQGVAAARNNGIAATDCEYIICLDADDQLGPEYVRVCRDALKADRGLGIAYTGLGLLGDDGAVYPSPFPPAFDWEKQATPGNPPHTTIPTAAMFRRSMWARAGGYQQVHAPGEDAEFYTRGLSAGFNARKVDEEPLIWYRNHPNGASKTKTYKAIDHYHPWMRDKHYPFAAPANKAPVVRSYHRPLISVIIPVGPGHARYLPAALDSLLMQSYRQWEVIAVDDSGAGEIGAVLTPYPFVRRYATPRGRQGPGAARNIGIDQARAPLVLFLDADDWLTEPDALGAMLAAQAKTGRYIYTDWICLENGKVWQDAAPEYNGADWFVKGQHAVTVLMPTQWACDLRFDEALAGWEDWDFFANAATKGYCGHRLDRALLGYRKYSGTIRNRSYDNRETLAPLIRGRYERATAMTCACGPAGAEMLRIRQEMAGEANMSTVEVQAGKTLLEYIGGAAGQQSVRSRAKPAHRYTYGGTADRTIAVYDEDLTFMLSLGIFQEFFQPAPQPAPLPLGGAAPTIATVAPPTPSAPLLALPGASDDDDVPAIDLSGFDPAAIAAATEAKAQQAAETVKRRGLPRRDG